MEINTRLNICNIPPPALSSWCWFITELSSLKLTNWEHSEELSNWKDSFCKCGFPASSIFIIKVKWRLSNLMRHLVLTLFLLANGNVLGGKTNLVSNVYFKMFEYYSETQSIRRIRSKLKDISKILKSIGGILGKDQNSFEIRISHPGNKTEASFQIERLSDKISVNIVQPLGEVEKISLSWGKMLI